MGMIGRWIDERCKAEPDRMRQTMSRPWNNLAAFISGDDGCKRGCMIGTYVLVKHPTAWSACLHVSGETFRVGGTYVVGLLNRIGSPRSIALLKQRIRKSLGIAPENRPVQHLESVSR